MSARIVITGFESWERGTKNPTLEILDQLAKTLSSGGSTKSSRRPQRPA